MKIELFGKEMKGVSQGGSGLDFRFYFFNNIIQFH